MRGKLKYVLGVFSASALLFASAAPAFATLTFDATSVVGSAALTLTGAAASVWDVGAFTLSLQTAGNGAITTGTGLVTTGGALTVTGVLTANGNVAIGNAATDTLTVTSVVQGASPLVFEGATADDFELTFAVPDVSADATITFPSVTGTLATLAGTETLSGKTLTAPKFADLGFIADVSGGKLLAFDSVASPVNYLQIAQSATGVTLSVTALGTDTDIGVSFNAKGAGAFRFQEQSATGDTIAIDPQETSAAAFTGTITNVDLTANKTWTLPNATGGVVVATDSSTATQALFATATAGAPAYRAIADADVPNTITVDLSTAATTATHLAGGLGGQIPYQSAAGTTAMLANGTAGQVLQSNGTTVAPSWVTVIAALDNASAWTVAQKLDAGITVDTTNFTVSGTTGAVHTAGDFDVATNKFAVAAATGNITLSNAESILNTTNGSITFASDTANADTISIAPKTGGGASIAGVITSADLTTSTRTWTFPDASGTVSLLDGTEELTNKTLNASVGKGTWTASGTWTLPAITLGGVVSGGGQQLNNIIIGTVTPLAGSFTTLSGSTSVTVGGGTAITKVEKATTAAIDLGAATDTVCVFDTSNVIADAALGDTVRVAPLLDDGAWDTGTLSAFVESAGIVKIVYCAGIAGGNPGSMTYNLALIKF